MSAARTVALLAAIALTAALSFAQSGGTELEALRSGNDALRQKLAQLIVEDPVIESMAKIREPVIVAIRTSLVERTIREIAFHYLDRIELNLAPDIHVSHEGVVTKKTFLGTVKGGTWSVDLNVQRIKGVFRSKSPKVVFAGANKVNLTLPLRVETGRGTAAFSFKWDSAGVANLVCKDFAISDTLNGSVVPAEYSVSGSFVFGATPDAIVARPQFADQKFRINVDLTPESWAKIQKALDEQDTFGKCGIALKPPEIMEKLRGLGRKGFDVKLPKSLIRPMNLPASIEQQVNVQDNIVQLAVKPGVLNVDGETLVFSSTVETSVAAMAIRPAAKKPAAPPAR